MKLSRLLPFSYLAALLFFSACNGDESKTDATSSDTTGTTTSAANEPAVQSTIVTTPQSMMLVRHKVSDFAKWKISYDAHDSIRLANGLHSYVIGRGADDSNLVLVVVKADDITKAKTFSKDASLKTAMQKGGVVGAPNITFINTSYQDTATLSSPLRSITTFSVKDWGAWRKSFDEGAQERIDNGIVTRTIAQDATDSNKVVLATALTDTAKAHAYWKSDMLKKRRAAGGVTSEPSRFVFNVVQRY